MLGHFWTLLWCFLFFFLNSVSYPFLSTQADLREKNVNKQSEKMSFKPLFPLIVFFFFYNTKAFCFSSTIAAHKCKHKSEIFHECFIL